MRIILCSVLFFLTSCSKGYLSVEQEWVDASFLASSWVNTPDPRQKKPPVGQRLLVSWSFPKSVFEKKLDMILTMRLWDQTETVISTPIKFSTDSKAFFFADDTEKREKRILTYKIEVIDRKGKVVENWIHQFWRDQIDFRHK